jgi:hypothetical protein
MGVRDWIRDWPAEGIGGLFDEYISDSLRSYGGRGFITTIIVTALASILGTILGYVTVKLIRWVLKSFWLYETDYRQDREGELDRQPGTPR